MLAAVALRSSNTVDAATIERHSWARARMASFFPDIVENWSNREFKWNFRVNNVSEIIWNTVLFLYGPVS